MRIGFDARYVQDHFPGIGRYAYNLLDGLLQMESADTFVVLYHPSAPNRRYDLTRLKAPNLELRPVPLSPFSWQGQWRLPRLARSWRLDVFHSPYYLAPYFMPCPLVVTIHDAIPARDPRYLPSMRSRLVFRVAVTMAVRRAQQVIVDSQASQKDLVAFFGAKGERVKVVPLAADEFIVAKAERPVPELVEGTESTRGLSPYFLCVSISKPHKNLVRLVEAFALANLPQHRLVIAGAEDPRFPQARRRAAQLGLGERVRFLGPVDDAKLRALYLGAEAFVFPSLVEGFGLPVLEAMASGVPVVASDIEAIQEVTADAALLVEPTDVEAWAGALRQLAADPGLRQALEKRGRTRAQLFSWAQTARQTRAVYEEACRS